MSKRVFVLLAEGFEEVEALTPVDLLRRAGADVKMVSVSEENIIKGAHGVPVVCDAVIARVENESFDALVLPGGMPGAENLAASAPVERLLKKAADGGLLIAAICASPALVLAPKGFLNGKKFTCYPGMEGEALKAAETAGAREAKTSNGAKHLADRVVVDGNLITSSGVGTAADFSLAVIEKLFNSELAGKVGKTALILE